MLVLSRNPNETIVLQTEPPITITFVRCTREGRARIGVDAPKSVSILRGELLSRDQHEGPLEADGGPPGAPSPAPSECVDDWRHETGVAPDISILGITPKLPR